MRLFTVFRQWETKYALTFMGFLVGILGTVFALYAYFQRTTPNLRIEERSRANVIDVREEVGELDITYNGGSLRDKHQTLAMVTLRFSNDGAAAISKGAYDDTAPLGIEITGGLITKVGLFGGSNPYIASHLRPSVITNTVFMAVGPDSKPTGPVSTNSVVTLTPVILEPGDSFWMKVLVLHSEKSVFDLKPIGKIAGIREITFVPLAIKEAPPPSFWMRTFGGNGLVQGLRFFLYFFVPLFALTFLVGMAAKATTTKKRVTQNVAMELRNRKVSEFKSVHPEEGNYGWLLTEYAKHGEDFINMVQLCMKDESFIEKAMDNAAIRTAVIRSDGFSLNAGKLIVDDQFRRFFLRFATFIDPTFRS